jgi:hypothetical protein
MQFNLTDAPEIPDDGIQVGDIYASKQNRVTHYWLVVAVRGENITVLGLDKTTGQITTGQSYGRYVFEGNSHWKGRKRIGRCLNFNTTFDIEWGPTQ